MNRQEVPADIELSVIIPAYNEEKKIERDLSQACQYLDQCPFSYEIIVVDDASGDRTVEVGQAAAHRMAPDKPIRFIRQPENLGKGAAVRAGMREARGRYALFADAGTCVPYNNLDRGLALLKGGVDMAYGTRAVTQARILKKQPLYRRMGSIVFHWIVTHPIGLPEISDTQCGFKMFTQKAYQDIFQAISTRGFMFDIETFLYARERGFAIQSFPVDWSNDPDTRFKPVSGSIRNFMEIIAIKWRIHRMKRGRPPE